MNKNIKIILIILIIILLVGFFYPKTMVVGGLGGLVMIGQSAYLEQYDCFGINYVEKLDYTQCADCRSKELCFGLTYNKRCYNETTVDKIEMLCG